VLPDFHLAPGHEPEFAPGYFTRTLRELRVEFGSRQPTAGLAAGP
jgi:hypothetical protein